MEPKSDAQLLREYAEHGAEAAFTEIVVRYTNLVHSAALRQSGSPDAAAEIAQTVFISLARGARALSAKLDERASIAGWLCRSARNVSLNFKRDEFRRHSRERQAMDELYAPSSPATDWDRLAPVLDEAMSELSDPDYDALVMRFFQSQDLRSVGFALEISDDAAQKRVTRALDRLREVLMRRGINTIAASLPIMLTANAVQAAPAGLSATITHAAFLSSPFVATLSTTITKGITMTVLQKAVIGVAIVACAVTPIVIQHNANLRLREENRSLHQDIDQLGQLKTENERLSNMVTQLKRAQIPVAKPSTELLRLRGEVGLLRQQNQGLAKTLAEKQRNEPGTNFQSSSTWAYSGNATPEAAAGTFAWAIKTGDTAKLSEVLLPAQDSGPNANANSMAEAVAGGLQPLMSEIEASRVILTDESTPNQVTYWFQSRFKDGNTMVSPITVQRVGNEWKVKLIIGGETTTPPTP